MKLGLGTVQFGLDYGVSNIAGKTPAKEVRRILEFAAASGIRVLDTAPAYGTSEEVLGQNLPTRHAFAIVTKIPALSAEAITDVHLEHVRRSFRQSRSRLGQERLYGLLVHDVADLLARDGERLMRVLVEFKEQGLVSKIGVSIYNEAQIHAVLGRYPIDLIQLPVNVLDQRLLRDGHLAQLKQRNIELHARSVFLQGVLLMFPERLPAHFAPVRDHLECYFSAVRRCGLTPLQAALGFVLGIAELDCVLCGVNSLEQLQEISAAAGAPGGVLPYADFASRDEAILDPSRWPR